MSSCNDSCADNISIIVDTGSRGEPGPPGPPSKVLEWTYYLNPGDTIISGDDASAKPLAYTPDSVQVYLNGVQLSKRDDYTTDEDGLSIVLNEAIVNANDIMVIVSQVPPEEGYDPTNDFDRLDGKIQDNTDAIEGLDVRVTANEEAIEGLTGLADGFTTRDVKLSGVNTTRSVDEPLETQQNLNIHFDGLIAANEERIDAIEGGQPDLTSDIEGLREDVDLNTGAIADNSQAIGDLADVVEVNTNSIDGLQTQIDKLPPPTDISDLEKDVDDIAKSVGTNTIAIAKNTADIAALEEPVDLDPLNAAIATNAAGINQNAKDIVNLKATDATLTGQVNDLEAAVGDLEAIDIPKDIAFTNVDNAFDTAQTIKSGLNITGADAFIEMDKGTALTVSNDNAYNPVIEIERSNGDVSLALHADGHIRGVKTDGADVSSAVSVGWFQDNVGAGGGDVDLSEYATKIELKTEEVARIQGDELLAKELEDAISTQKYDDTKLTNRVAQEEEARKAGDSSLDKKIKTEAQYREEEDDALQAQLDALQIPAVDPALYATVVAMEKGDADTLAAANTFTTEAIAAIEFPELPEGLATEEFVTNAIDAIEFPAGTILSDDAPEDATDGDYWFDTNRLELFIYYQDAWVTTTPLGARIDEGEAIQRVIIEQINDSVDKQVSLIQTVNDRARVQDAIVVSTKLLSDKVDALEGSTLDAKYKADPRDNPSTGGFVLQDAGGNKVLQFSAAEKIELSKTDFTNKVIDISHLMNGDFIRLVLSADNYANYTITSVETGDETFTLGLTFRSAGTEEVVFDGAVYDFTHGSYFDPEAFATIDYVDACDETVKQYTDQQLVDVAKISTRNTFKEIQTFEKSTYFQNIVIHNGKLNDTLTEVRGENEDTKQLWHKIRATSRVSWICYPGQENKDYKRCLEMEWDADSNAPLVKLDFLQPPTQGRHAATKQYVDNELKDVLKRDDQGHTDVEQEWRLRSKATDNTNWTFLKIEQDKFGVYHLQDPEEWHHAAHRKYVDESVAGKLSVDEANEVSTGFRIKGDGGTYISTSGGELGLYHVKYPETEGHAATKEYVDDEIAKVGGGSGATANSGTTTPTLATGEMFFNTSSKILFIGDS